MATRSELRDTLNDLGADQPPDDASHADLENAVREARAAAANSGSLDGDAVASDDRSIAGDSEVTRDVDFPPDDKGRDDDDAIPTVTRDVDFPPDDKGRDDDDAIPTDHAARDADGDLYPFYCPGCGRGQRIEGVCNGSAEGPHGPIQTVSTDELYGDPESHTAAPDSV